jgi:hypothetical protein
MQNAQTSSEKILSIPDPTHFDYQSEAFQRDAAEVEHSCTLPSDGSRYEQFCDKPEIEGD